MTIRTDPKIARISDSWLALDPDDAAWLATVADEIVVPAGRPIGDRGFGYVSLTDDLTIATAEEPVTFDRPTPVLAVTTAELAVLRGASPALRPIVRAA
ncbi:MAG: hypothetical protein AAGD33_15685 [Actinomycetota bacterium]